MTNLRNPLNFLALLPAFLFAQVSDNFADGDLTNNPVWLGDAAHFTVNSESQLQLNAGVD